MIEKHGSAYGRCSFDTYQFRDYSKVVADRFDLEKKTRRHLEVFPKDCEKALGLGMRFAQNMDSVES